MTVAVLDNGICSDELKTPIRHVCVGASVDKTFRQRDKTSHGTVCAKIIEKYCDVDELVDVTFVGENDKAGITDMCEALELCLNENVDVINLSCGIEDYSADSAEYNRLLDICKRLYDKKIIIYAAQNNIGRLTIPANFPYTLSVEQKDNKQNKLTSLFRRSDIYTSGKHLIKLDNKYTFTTACNSFACAYATSKYNHRWFSIKNKNRLISTEVDYKTKKLINKEAGNYPKTNIPIIYIENHPRAARLAGMIKDSFLEMGYNTDILSSNKYDSLMGAFYVPEDCMTNYINLFAYFNDNDVVIVISEKTHDVNDDVLISIEGDDQILKSEKGIERVGDYSALFEKILKNYNTVEK